MTQTERHRKNFAALCSVIAGAITLISVTMTFSTFQASFADWPPTVKNILAFLCCAAVEATVVGLIYGLMYALAGLAEIALAGGGLIFTVGVMATNLITHSMQVKGIPLSPWQQNYIDWVGPGVLIVTFGLMLGFPLLRIETKQRRLDRKLELRTRQTQVERALERLDQQPGAARPQPGFASIRRDEGEQDNYTNPS